MVILIKILATLALVALNAFFVAAEYASISARTSRLRTNSKNTMADRAALLIKSRLDLFLASCQLGTSLAALGLGAMTAPAVETLIAPFASGLHLSPEAQHAVAFLISFTIALGLQIVVGEQTPKNIAIEHADGLLMVLGIPLVVFTYVFYPATWLLNAATHLVLRVLGAQQHKGALGMKYLPHTEEELHSLLLQAAAQGTIPE